MQSPIIPQPKVIRHMLHDDGQFPNSNLFLLIYKEAIKLPGNDSSVFKKIFKSNNWTNSWLNGIYDYHHYHSITHEVLGIYKGHANVQFGGPNGIAEDVSKGDVIIIPAGVAHRNVTPGSPFKCVGAYPDGMDYDIKKGEPGERPEADNNIKKVPLPEKDPVYGSDGPLILNWAIR